MQSVYIHVNRRFLPGESGLPSSWLRCRCRHVIAIFMAASLVFTWLSWLTLLRQQGILISNFALPRLYGLSKTWGSRANYSSADTDKLVKEFEGKYKKTFYTSRLNESYSAFIKRLIARRKKGSYMQLNNPGTRSSSWERFFIGINQYYLYDPYEGNVLDDLLKDLSTRAVIRAVAKGGGSQFKIKLTFDNGAEGIMKPMRFPRDKETLPNHFYFHDFERHNAEIAAFHLDKILGFNRAPPTVGRYINITRDILRVLHHGVGVVFIYTSPARNLCMIGNCSQYCGSTFAFCGSPDMIEGSISLYLPQVESKEDHDLYHPWKRTYSEKLMEFWKENDDYCEIFVKRNSTYETGRRLLDLVDMAVFDFLTGNMDRHSYQLLPDFQNDTFPLHIDQGRGFGKSKYDCMSCLAPLYQCRIIRVSTLAKLIKLYQGPDSLSSALRDSMQWDPLAPILLEPHLDALDRRLDIILKMVYNIRKTANSYDEVIIDDGVI